MCPRGSDSCHTPRAAAQPTRSWDRHSHAPLLGLEESDVMVPECHLEQLGCQGPCSEQHIAQISVAMEDGTWSAPFCLNIEGVEMVEKVGAKQANTNKCHKPKQSKAPKPKTPPNPKLNLWAGTMAKEFHQRLSYFFCATDMLLLARGALMLFIGPLL